jgi:hypothetical protein
MDALHYHDAPAVRTGIFPASVPSREHSITELIALMRAVDTLLQVAMGLGHNHSFMARGGSLNEAGAEFDAICDDLSERHLNLFSRLRDATPTSRQDIEDRQCELLKHDLGCDQDVTDVALAAVVKEMPANFR